MALNYTSVARIYDLEPMIGSISDLTSSQIVTAFAEPAEAEINARIAKLYTVPVAGTTPLLQAIADDISVYRILSRRVFTQDQLKDSVWPDRFKESMETLSGVAKGEIILVDSAGAVIGTLSNVAQAKTNVQNYLPTFHEGGTWEDQIKDQDKIDDELDARSL